MKRIAKCLGAFWRLAPLFFALPFLAPAARADLPAVEVITRLGGDPNGYHPRGALVAGKDGNFYGTTTAGGGPNCGTVFKITPGGTLTTIYTFTGQTDGANPLCTLIRATDGDFYGTTSSGGSGHSGTVFKITTAGALTTVHAFSAVAAAFPHANADGSNPQVGVIQGSDGNFYGTTYFGGTKGGGVIFKMTPPGAVTALASFDAESGLPTTGVVEGSANVFYGAVYPSFFKITSAGVMTTLHNFSASDVGFPQTTLVKGADGNFYGTSESLAVRLTTTGAVTTLHTFNSATEGTPLNAPLILAGSGNFYGVTGRDGATGFGAAYQMTPAGAVTVLAGIPGPGDGVAQANALLRASDGSFYGTVQLTGAANAGTVFKLAPGGALTTLHAFNAGGGQCVARLAQYSDGKFYGVAQEGGAMNAGTIFAASTTGKAVTIHDFNPSTEGAGPRAGLVADGSGGYFGATSLLGPNGGGVIFQLTPSAVESSVASLGGNSDKVPFYDILQVIESDEHIDDTTWLDYFQTRVGLLWDDAFGGGDGLGSISQFTPPPSSQTNAVNTEADDSGVTVVYSFTGGADGELPIGDTAPDAAGNRYGVTQLAGAHGQGTVYKLTPAGVLTTLYAFAGTGDGALPDGGLTNGKDGNFYGTTSATSYDASTGNTTGHGTIFKLTPAGVFTTLHTFASDGSEGFDSQAALLQASDGKLYGTTTQGAGSSGGTVFSITTGGTFTLLHSFSLTLGGDGSFPVATMIQATDGNLYGTTQSGGTDGFGTIYKVVLAAPGLPAATLTVPKPIVQVDSHKIGEVVVELSFSRKLPVVVHYSVQGSAVNGKDYEHLSGNVKFTPGETKASIKIIPLGDLDGAKSKLIKIKLQSGDGYTIQSRKPVEVTIRGQD